MTQVFVVPGIFGVSMRTPIKGRQETIWPPGETGVPISTPDLVRYLTDAATSPARVIRKIACVGTVYGDLVETLAGIPGVTVTEVPYDWRIDLGATADTALAASLDGLDGDDDIVFVAHSMGGLVVRWLIESGLYAGRPWFSRIARAIFIAVPHLGAPLALFRILGLDALDPIILPGWAMRDLASDPKKYPSGYQLLPAPGESCVDQTPGPAEDLYHSSILSRLDGDGVAAVRRLYNKIGALSPPAHVDYNLLYGTGHETVSGIRIGQDGAPNAVSVTSGGDGTVPSWSARPSRLGAASAQEFHADHIGILSGAGPLACIRWLIEETGPAHQPQLPDGLELYSTWPLVGVGARVRLVFAVNGPARPVAGTIACRNEADEAVWAFPIASGGSVVQMPLSFDLPHVPGTYSLTFDGQPRSLSKPLMVRVVDDKERDRLGLADAPAV